MAYPVLKRSLPKRTSLVILATAISVSLSPDAEACSWGIEPMDELTFDPSVFGYGTYADYLYQPDVSTVGTVCDDCAEKEMRADWGQYLGDALGIDAWMRILLSAPLEKIETMIATVKAKGDNQPGQARVLRALYFVGFARRVEPFAQHFADQDGNEKPTAPVASDAFSVQERGMQALKREREPFFRQRYAFQILRILFYRKAYKEAVEFFEKHQQALESPSQHLKARAWYYTGGAYKRQGMLAEANLWFARVFHRAPGLAPTAARDFEPMQQSDWNKTLALAKSVEERVAIWSLVGVKHDAFAAMEAIEKLDLRSEYLPLLTVREMTRGELSGADLKNLETTSVRLLETKHTARPWVFALVAGHIAALRGDVPTTRQRIAVALRLNPKSPEVELQAKVSLAIALSTQWTGPGSSTDDELAALLQSINVTPESRLYGVRDRIVRRLSDACHAGGFFVEAALWGRTYEAHGGQQRFWYDERFIASQIELIAEPRTAMQKVMVAATQSRTAALQRDLLTLYLVRGELDRAQRFLHEHPTLSGVLRTNPFVARNLDCHDCDHMKFGDSGWTHASVIEHMIGLKKIAGGKGQVAAAAAFELATAFYNITYVGNARTMIEGGVGLSSTHQTRMAMQWYRTAMKKSKEREFKARAAFMSAKAELALMLDNRNNEQYDLPVPKVGFRLLNGFQDTAYYKEILAECGHFRRWTARSHHP